MRSPDQPDPAGSLDGVSNHPSENTTPVKTVDAGNDPILIWYGLVKPYMVKALENVDQAYRDAKVAASTVDAANRRAATERRKSDPAGLSESAGLFDHESDALHRTHLRAMEIHASIATGLASSIRDVLSMQQIELPEMVIEG